MTVATMDSYLDKLLENEAIQQAAFNEASNCYMVVATDGFSDASAKKRCKKILRNLGIIGTAVYVGKGEFFEFFMWAENKNKHYNDHPPCYFAVGRWKADKAGVPKDQLCAVCGIFPQSGIDYESVFSDEHLEWVNEDEDLVGLCDDCRHEIEAEAYDRAVAWAKWEEGFDIILGSVSV